MKILLFLMIFIVSFGLLIPAYSYIEGSPYQQWKNGTLWYNIICKDDFFLVTKISTGHPACIKLDTAIHLYKRGWTQNLHNDVWYEWSKKTVRQFIFQNLTEYNVQEETLKLNIAGVRGDQLDVGVAFSSHDEMNNKSMNHTFVFVIVRGDNIKSIHEQVHNENGTSWKKID